ncbi:MAG: ATP-binding protein [Holophagaceae bacterium]|nr:ATP-binding protein [Holophagaceae bacterium]
MINKLLSWLPFIISGAVVIWGVALFIARLSKIRNTPRPDPEFFVLGAVSQSLKERGELAANLGELRTVHEKLLNALPIGILWVDQRGNIGGLNMAGQALLGIKEIIAGHSVEDALKHLPWMLEALATDSDDLRRVTDRNSRRWEIRKILAPASVGVIVQFEDVTNRENEEKRLALQNRFAELGQMTAGLAHQLKNGLAVLRVQGQLLDKSGQTEAASEILQEVTLLEQLATSFLLWAKPLSPERMLTDLAMVADEAITEIRRRPCSSKVVVERRGVGRAEADSVLLKEALINIIENACQASPDSAEVNVNISEKVIEILDMGSGLESDDMDRIIRPFESGRQNGTGLGLPLAYKWLSAMGADLTVKRREEGGSKFVIRW